MKRYIYIVVSETPTRFGNLVRRFGGCRYNHAAISLDSSFREWYSFARVRHATLLNAKLVRENVDRYTLRRVPVVPCKIYRIPVTDVQYQRLQKFVKKVYLDDEYIYNYPSVFTYPVLHGRRMYKAFTCVEFAVQVLAAAGIPLQYDRTWYTPDALAKELTPYLVYRGNLVTYIKRRRILQRDNEYFRGLSARDFYVGAKNTLAIAKRLF